MYNIIKRFALMVKEMLMEGRSEFLNRAQKSQKDLLSLHGIFNGTLSEK